MSVQNDVFQVMQPQSYEALRPQLQNGDIALFSGVEIFSHAIQWATKSPFSHVGFIFRLDAIDRVMVLQALTTGTCAVALSAMVNGTGPRQRPYNGRLLIARHAGLAALATATNLKAMSEFAVDRFGAPYGTTEIIKIMLRIVAGRLNMRMPKLLIPDDEYICSEYAAVCFSKIGLDIAWDGLGFIAPCDFASDPNVSAVGVVKTRARP
jgi:hypothetical protein